MILIVIILLLLFCMAADTMIKMILSARIDMQLQNIFIYKSRISFGHNTKIDTSDMIYV